MKISALYVPRRVGSLATAMGLLVALAASGTAAAAAPKTAAPTAAPNAGQALEIGPPVINLTADPGQVIKTQVSLRDISSSNLLVTGQVNDFVAAGEDGTPKIILDSSEVDPFSIRTWVGSLPQLTLKPREIKQLPITITVPTDASPGGHYGVVRFTGTPPELKGTGVSLSASLGSLFLIRVNGAVKESLSTEQFFVSQNNNNAKPATLFESAPIRFTERIKNTGNIHEQPSGQVIIKNMFGKKIAAINVNLPPHNVLPSSIRKFNQPLDASVIGGKRLFGKYTATMNLTYGGSAQTLTSSLSFWVIPYKLIGVVIIALVIAFFVFRFLIIRYNRRIVGNAYKHNRRR